MGSQSRVVEDRTTSEELENVLCKRPFQEITKEEDQGNKVEQEGMWDVVLNKIF